jgi:hypothetical protein
MDMEVRLTRIARVTHQADPLAFSPALACTSLDTSLLQVSKENPGPAASQDYVIAGHVSGVHLWWRHLIDPIDRDDHLSGTRGVQGLSKDFV